MRIRLIALALLALTTSARADFVFDIGPSEPARIGAILLVGHDVTAVNLGITSVTDGVKTVALGEYLDLTTIPSGNFFVLDGPVRVAGGTEPFAYGLGGTSTLTHDGGRYELTMTGLDARLTGLLAPAFGVDPSLHYAATLTLDFVVDPRLAGDQVLCGSIVLSALPGCGQVPEPSSLLLLGLGTALAAFPAFRRR